MVNQEKPLAPFKVNIEITGGRHRFYAGELVAGHADMVLPVGFPLDNVHLSFHCVGTVRWVEVPHDEYYFEGNVINERHVFHEETQNFHENGMYLNWNVFETWVFHIVYDICPIKQGPASPHVFMLQMFLVSLGPKT